MYRGKKDSDTICAISSPQGYGGISVIRVSGPKALEIVKKMAPFLPENIESHRQYFGRLKKRGFLSIDQQEKIEEKVIDEVLISYFKTAKSFTGEETLEISGHGNPYLNQLILKQLLDFGARTAEPGEFTYRAFMNGRLDLIQAESVLSLIQAQSSQSIEQSLRQLKGEFSKQVLLFEKELIFLLAHVEASIDFSTENLEIISFESLKSKLFALSKEVEKVLLSYQAGKIIKNGFKVVIAGSPNVGKSSLMNLLCEEEKAIVTEIPGTTRDLIEGQLLVNGLKVLLLDTAGLRTSDDYVETLGIQKSFKSIEEADLIFVIVDLTKKVSDFEKEFLKKLNLSKTILLANKMDLLTDIEKESQTIELKKQLMVVLNKPFLDERMSLISTFDKQTVEKIKTLIHSALDFQKYEDKTLLFQTRHYDNFLKISKHLQEALILVEEQASYEFLSFELSEALFSVQETLGKKFDDQIIDKIFSEFCLGK